MNDQQQLLHQAFLQYQQQQQQQQQSSSHNNHITTMRTTENNHSANDCNTTKLSSLVDTTAAQRQPSFSNVNSFSIGQGAAAMTIQSIPISRNNNDIPTATTTTTNISSSLSQHHQLQKIKHPYIDFKHPYMSISTTAVTSSSPPPPPPPSAVPIQIMALPANTPNFASTTKTTKSTQLNHNTYHNSSVKLAAVPTNRLASKSAFTLNPEFLHTVHSCDKKEHVTSNTPAATTNTTTTATTSTTNATIASSLSPNEQNTKKRSSPDVDIQENKKRMSSTGLISCTSNGTSSSPTTSLSTRIIPSSPFESNNYKQITSLQSHFDNILSSRGYSTNNYCSLETGYYNKPTPLQIASHGITVVQAIRRSDKETLQKLLNLGLSPNPCNKFGESIIHTICRRGDHDLLKLFMDYGCNLQVCDDFGRTPLHDACWTAQPNFSIIELILRYDKRLMSIVDCRGSGPLSYVKRDHWDDWAKFLDTVKDEFWNIRDISKEGEETPPELVGKVSNSVPLHVTGLCKGCCIEDVANVAMGKVALTAAVTVNRGKPSSTMQGNNDNQGIKIESPPPPIAA